MTATTKPVSDTVEFHVFAEVVRPWFSGFRCSVWAKTSREAVRDAYRLLGRDEKLSAKRVKG